MRREATTKSDDAGEGELVCEAESRSVVDVTNWIMKITFAEACRVSRHSIFIVDPKEEIQTPILTNLTIKTIKTILMAKSVN